MKKIILSICLLISFSATIFAQSTATTATLKTNIAEQQTYGSAINHFEAGFSRNNKAMIQSSANDLMQMMQAHIAQNIKLMNDATNDQAKADLGSRIKTENELAADFKTMSVDIDKNHKEMAIKARAFGDTF